MHYILFRVMMEARKNNPKQVSTLEISNCVKCANINSANNENWPRWVTWPSWTLMKLKIPHTSLEVGEETEYFWTIIQIMANTKSHFCLGHKCPGDGQCCPRNTWHCSPHGLGSWGSQVCNTEQLPLPSLCVASVSPVCYDWGREPRARSCSV